jgi:deoxyhypusine synthase
MKLEKKHIESLVINMWKEHVKMNKINLEDSDKLTIILSGGRMKKSIYKCMKFDEYIENLPRAYINENGDQDFIVG